MEGKVKLKGEVYTLVCKGPCWAQTDKRVQKHFGTFALEMRERKRGRGKRERRKR